jgi:TolB-like protein
MKSARLLLFLFFIPGCGLGPGNLDSKHSSDLEARKIKRIAVLGPATMAKSESKIPFTAASPADARAAERDPAELLSKLVYSAMTSFSNWQIVSENEVREIGETVPDSIDATRLKTIGELVYADAVVVGRMQRFRERVGAEWGIKSPASVAFVLDLVDVKRGDIVWSARFDETQKSPAENIFVLGDIGQRGVKWLSAEQLTESGVRKAVGQLNQIIAR